MKENKFDFDLDRRVRARLKIARDRKEGYGGSTYVLEVTKNSLRVLRNEGERRDMSEQGGSGAENCPEQVAAILKAERQLEAIRKTEGGRDIEALAEFDLDD